MAYDASVQRWPDVSQLGKDYHANCQSESGSPIMHTSKFLVAFVVCLTSTLAQAAGFRFIDVPADADNPAP